MKCLFKCSRLGIPCLLPGTSNSLMKIQFFFDIVFFFRELLKESMSYIQPDLMCLNIAIVQHMHRI